jgi:hypothetical protein
VPTWSRIADEKTAGVASELDAVPNAREAYQITCEDRRDVGYAKERAELNQFRRT